MASQFTVTDRLRTAMVFKDAQLLSQRLREAPCRWKIC